MPLPLSYSSRNLWVRRGATFATMAGIALVVFVLAASQMLANGLRMTFGSSGRDDRAVVLQQSAYAEPNSRLRQEVLGLVAAAPGVRTGADNSPLVTGESVVQITLPSVEDPERLVSVFVRGVGENVLEMRPKVRIVDGRAPRAGTDEAMLGVRLQGRYRGLRLGEHLELQEGRKMQIVGAFESSGSSYESEVWVDLDALRSSLAWEGYLSSVTVQLESASSFDAFAEEVQRRSNNEAIAERESAYYARVSRGLSSVIEGLGRLVAVIFSLGAMLGAAITMHSSVGQRTREIGVLRALGFERSHILLAFLLEACTLAGVGTALGVALALLTPLVELQTVNAATGAQVAVRFAPSVAIILGSMAIGGVVGVLGGLFPALRAARVGPLQVLRA